MKKILFIISLTLSPAFLFSGVSDKSRKFDFEPGNSSYLKNPEMAIGYVDSCADFWLSAYDAQFGGFFSDVDKAGNPLGNTKHLISQTRNAYGFIRAFMLTGDETHLQMAEDALDFMYEYNWDSEHGGWYGNLQQNGEPVDAFADKNAFDQHYALLGIAAAFDATRDQKHFDRLLEGYEHLESIYWDSRAGLEGYYDITNFDGSDARNKSFNATVDAITTHLLYLYLMTESTEYLIRLQELAEQIVGRLVASISSQAIGFAEKYDSDWNADNSETTTLMGHVLKTGWCLGRIYQLDPEPEYLSNAQILIQEVLNKAYDDVYGGPFKDYNRVTGQVLSGTDKAWWQMEQAITGGLQLFDLTGDSTYYHMADESLDFFMTYFVDREYGEVYADRTREGNIAFNEIKGSQWKAAYHSTETGYYTYLYGNLFVHKQPVILHYVFDAAPEDRIFPMTPLAIADAELLISQVMKDGEEYANYDSEDRLLMLPANVAGHFEVTYKRTILSLNVPVLILPQDGVSDIAVDPLFSWSPVDGASSYQLQVSASASFVNLAVNELNISVTSFTAQSLNFNTTFYWRVRALAQGAESEWSEIRHFTTEAEILASPALILPADGAVEVSIDPVLAWSKPEGTDSFQIQVATDENFTAIEFDSSGHPQTSIDIAGLAYSTDYYWRVKGFGVSGNSGWSNPRSFTTETSSTFVSDERRIPENFGLSKNYPNPFNPGTTIEYQLPQQAFVKLDIYNMAGQLLVTLQEGVKPAGVHRIYWNGSDRFDRQVASGIYFYRLQAGEFVQVKKLSVLR